VAQRRKSLDNFVNSDMKVVNTVKVLKLNANESIIDSNSVQLPCIAEYRGKRITMLEYTWDVKSGNNVAKRGIKVSGHGEYGVPTLRELDVLIALQCILINDHIDENGIVKLKTENLKEEDLYINFTINQLAKELGYTSPNNNVRSSIKKSIEILTATTISNLYEGGIYDVNTRQYIKDPYSHYHYLESTAGYSIVNEDETKTIDVTKIKLSKFFYDMIVSDYRLYYDRDIYKKTKNLTARKIYLIALQWMGKKGYAFANISTLIQRVPMAQTELKYQKQYVKTALKNLNDKGLLKIVYDKNNRDKVYLVKPNVDFNENELYYLDKFNTYNEVITGLEEFELMPIEIPTVFDIEKIDYVRALLRYGNVLNNYGKIHSKKDWIVNYMEKGYEIDEKYYNSKGQ